MVTRPKVFVSFDYEHDGHYKNLLDAWSANPQFEFVFRDLTPGEINSSDIARIKAGLTARINLATHTLVIVGKYANAMHPRHVEIGERNWINWEIARSRSKQVPNRVAAIRLEAHYELPEKLRGFPVSWANGFDQDKIIQALASAQP